jgi:hypothetical protein
LKKEYKCEFINCEFINHESATMKPYEQSNRYKLSLAIKATGFTATKLSQGAGYADDYLNGYTSKSRLLVRGDITEKRLKQLIATVAFAERELLGLGAKTVTFEELLDANESKSNIWYWIGLAVFVVAAIAFNVNYK